MQYDKSKFLITNARKTKDFLICIDSDGCAFDTMNSKHKLAFAPLLIEAFNLHEQYDELFNLWQKINLYSKLRGVNRFKGVVLFLDYAFEKKYLNFSAAETEFFTHYVLWTQSASVLSNKGLEEFIEKNPQNTVAEKILIWSHAVNKKIASLGSAEKKVFENVFACIKHMSEHADIAVVSSANKSEIFSEWTHAHLLDFVQTVCTQEDGSKKESSKKLLELGYDTKNVLCLGDALSDLKTAEALACAFYPIIPDREETCWKQLHDKYLSLFFANRYSEKIENELKEKLKEKLP